jgi:glucose 1-dehydrogenase
MLRQQEGKMGVGRILAGQTAVVTGSNSGIGKATVRAMAAAGAGVVVNYVSDEDSAHKVVQDIEEAGGEAIAVKADVSRKDDVRALFGAAIEKYGTVDILVNNAGVQKDSEFLDMTPEQWRTVLDINLTGAFLCAKEAAREFVRRGVISGRSKAAGKIIFISSVHELIPWAGHVNYAASKGGIMMLMKSIAQELAPKKVRVNSIGPGAIKTDINRNAWESPEAEAELLKLIPYKRIGETEDIARVAVWLASDEADYINGTTIYVDGGMLLYPGFSTGG